MDNKIVGLDGKVVEPEPDYNTDVISLLETALADAKKYKAFAVGITLVMPSVDPPSDGTPLDTYDIDVYWHGRRLTLLAATARIIHRINLKCDEMSEVTS